jgi:aconitate hydratase
VRARADGGGQVAFRARARLDTPVHAEYFRHGGILPAVLRKLIVAGEAAGGGRA